MDVFHSSELATLIANTQIVVGLTGIPRAALEDVRLTDGTLLMPVDDDSVQRRLTSRASLLVCIGWVKGIVHGCDNLKRDYIIVQSVAAFE